MPLYHGIGENEGNVKWSPRGPLRNNSHNIGISIPPELDQVDEYGPLFSDYYSDTEDEDEPDLQSLPISTIMPLTVAGHSKSTKRYGTLWYTLNLPFVLQHYL